MPKFVSQGRPTSPAQEDYLKAIYRLAGFAGSAAVSTSQLAEELTVSPGSVSEMFGKLAALDLVTHDPYRGARLSAAGLRIAIEMTRHHRLIETYLVVALGYGWDEVHEEADRLEHAISERLEERMWRALGEPAFDPHGDPIPTPDFEVHQPPTQPLHAVPTGATVRISRISDRDPAKLRAVQALGLTPGRPVRIVQASQWESPVVVDREGEAIPVALGLARAIFVEDRRG
ncbi:MAG TPA: metal-dependent transcriptional regulator [Actinomycetota bacterium]|nr:metal-dependent transcriptional regulator [Actinomycetota bacterium]